MMMIVGLIVTKVNLVIITEQQGTKVVMKKVMMMITITIIMRTSDADGEVGVASVGDDNSERIDDVNDSDEDDDDDDDNLQQK